MQPSHCVVIPCFDHGTALATVLQSLDRFELTCYIVDDGSGPDTMRQLHALAAAHAGVHLLRLDENRGKGEAVLHGMRVAQAAGFTHALQVDADGQHRIEDVPAFLAESRRHPDAVIAGQPVFDASVPRVRLYGRMITLALSWAATLSLDIRDAMCGFRVYPIAPTLRAARVAGFSARMGFDPEILVRLHRAGLQLRFMRTAVTYPPDGISHFRMVRDNVRIAWMHSRLLAGVPACLARRLLRHRRRHWAEQPELKGLFGMRLMMVIYTCFGRRAFALSLWPAAAVCWLVAGTARRASRQWLRRVKSHAHATATRLPKGLGSYRHFMRFGTTMLDKVAGWRGELAIDRDILFTQDARELLVDAPCDAACGRLIIGSHVGNIDVCRALAHLAGRNAVNALVFTDNAMRYNRIITEYSPDALVNVISVREFGPEVSIMLQQKLDAGEWVAIMGDRIPLGATEDDARHVIWSEFLGQAAPFPAGPFILAGTLRCSTLLLFALRQEGRIRVHCEPFDARLPKPRTHRQPALQAMVDHYARRLAHYALMSPLDWFNFYDFWRLPEHGPCMQQTDRP